MLLLLFLLLLLLLLFPVESPPSPGLLLNINNADTPGKKQATSQSSVNVIIIGVSLSLVAVLAICVALSLVIYKRRKRSVGKRSVSETRINSRSILVKEMPSPKGNNVISFHFSRSTVTVFFFVQTGFLVRCLHLICKYQPPRHGIKLAFSMCLLQCLHCTDDAHICRNRTLCLQFDRSNLALCAFRLALICLAA